jgi:hypothetical protein
MSCLKNHKLIFKQATKKVIQTDLFVILVEIIIQVKFNDIIVLVICFIYYLFET